MAFKDPHAQWRLCHWVPWISDLPLLDPQEIIAHQNSARFSTNSIKNVGITIVNHPPVITIDILGINHSQSRLFYDCYTHITGTARTSLWVPPRHFVFRSSVCHFKASVAMVSGEPKTLPDGGKIQGFFVDDHDAIMIESSKDE